MGHPPAREERRERVRPAVVDQHASWIAVNPVQGCPKGCVYCFLNERGQTRVRPEQLATPAETVELLLGSEFYAPERAVALYTWTDVMALAVTRAHLSELLGLLADRQVANPVVLITKCRIPPSTIAEIVAARRAGLRVIIYLSYSGLDRRIERGIRHADSASNFPALAEAGIPIVHYWRPAFPDSATVETMGAVLDLVVGYARCTVAAGLKVEREAIPRLSTVWPALAATPGVETAEGVYPRPFWEFIHGTRERYPDYPLFHTNSCALSYVLGEPDRFGVFDSHTCRVRNHCPGAQRARCATAASAAPAPGDEAIRAALARRGLPGVSFTFDPGEGELILDAAVPNRWSRH